ncbi:MAG: TIGR03545 family protein [Bdellovibrionaceae bacterium]|nr:TIGR03545 family protein [Pseudobdellovibrionaceae bacterium]
MADTNTTSPAPVKPKKAKGPIRWEAIIPFAVIIVLIGLYFKLFFDTHMRSLAEFAGYHATGAEVNIRTFETSFFDASLRVGGIELTNPEKPTHNNLNIGEVRFSLLWDALLRVKFVINEASIENISFDQPRKKPGKVKPPEPEKESALQKEAEKLKDEALEKAKTQYDDNVFGNIANMMSGSNESDEMKKLESKLISKEKMKAFEATLQQKQKDWEERLKKLPKASEFQALGDRLKKVKTSGFSKPEEVQKAVAEVQTIMSEGQKKIDEVNATKNDFDKDLKLTDEGLKEIRTQIEKDIKDLQAHFKIPKIDAKSIAMTLFKRYTGPYFAKINHYRALFYKYAPPNIVNKDNKPEVTIQPRPRERGTNYEFGKVNAYPTFWLKKAMISSQFNSADPNSKNGNLKGEILDVTSNQLVTGRPTMASITGGFPSENIEGLEFTLKFDNRTKDALINAVMGVKSFAISEKQIVESPDLALSFKSAIGGVRSTIDLVNYKELTLKVVNEFKDIDYQVAAKNKDVEGILINVFKEARTTNMIAEGKGILPRFDLDIHSDLGQLLQKGFEREINAKIEELKKKIKEFVDNEINKQKEIIEKQVNELRTKAEAEIKKVQAQAEEQKKLAETKIQEAQKDIENRANAEKAKAEAEANRRIEEERQKAEVEKRKAQKAAEDEAKKQAEKLKKQLGF